MAGVELDHPADVLAAAHGLPGRIDRGVAEAGDHDVVRPERADVLAMGA